MTKIGIVTGGGDAPGLNAVIRSVVLTAHHKHGWEVVGIEEGFDGLLSDTPTIPLDVANVRDLLSLGGTILGTTNKGQFHPLSTQEMKALNSVSQQTVKIIETLGLAGVIATGGDGTMKIAHKLVELGAPIVGVPKTIDNDLSATDVTFGFDTAISIATDSLERLKTTAQSHKRVMILEVMGRDAGWIALHAGIAGGADAILIPEIPFRIDVIAAHLQQKRDMGQRYNLVIVAEGAHPYDGEQLFYIEGDSPDDKRLGGISRIVGDRLTERMDAEVRVAVLGHIQRGGQPTSRDRLLATAFGAKAIDLVRQQKWGHMVALKGAEIVDVPMADAILLNSVDVDGMWVQIARDLGISFG